MTVANLPISLDPICRVLASGRFNLTNEAATQQDIQDLLNVMLPEGWTVEREVRLSPADRPDFLIAGRVVVEVKVKRSWSAPGVLKQIARYAAHPQITGVVLASNRAMAVPDRINGKPLRFVPLGRAWL